VCLACKVLGSDLAGGPEVQYQIRTGAFTVGALVYLHCAGSSSGISYVLKFAPLTEHDRSINRQANHRKKQWKQYRYPNDDLPRLSPDWVVDPPPTHL
jgi:hypothetical protein